MKPKTAQFSLAALLTLSTGIKLSTPSFNEMHGMMEVMAGDAIGTVGLVLFADTFAPILMKQHPFLKEIDRNLFLNKSDVEIQANLDRLIAQYGNSFTVQRA